ncbi:MAG: hypothetical protein AAF787_07250 [Chloroflexota bacterium]
MYIDIKKKIGKRSIKQNIPDGYLLDLSSRKPHLYFVENELASHDPVRHIAIQLLEFSLAFDDDPRKVQQILFDAIHKDQDARSLCEKYIMAHGFRGLDQLLDEVIHDREFAALVIIDSVPERLQAVLDDKLRFAVEVLYLTRYSNADSDHLYRFEPFLSGLEVTADVSDRNNLKPDLEEVDTVIVPAREDGFNKAFIGENRWYAIRIGGIMRPRIKYIAVYRVAPVSAITHVAPVRSVEPWEDTDKFVVNFDEPATEISPISRGERVTHLQSLRYTSYERLIAAQSMDDI